MATKTLTTAPTNLDEQETARLIELHREVERTTEREERTKAAHAAAKAAYAAAVDNEAKFLHALSHGMPLFQANGEGEE